MSTRAQVRMVNSNIYLYQHSDGYDLPKEVQNAIKRHQRWDDEEYLARIIFDEMKGDDIDGELGFGIGNSEHGDIEYLVSVDVDKQTIRVKGEGFNNKVKYSFEEFEELDID